MPIPALPRSKAFPMLVTPSSITKVWARTKHAPSLAVMRTAVRLHLRNQNNISSNGIFCVLPSYVIWAYFIIWIHHKSYQSYKNHEGYPMRAVATYLEIFFTNTPHILSTSLKKIMRDTLWGSWLLFWMPIVLHFPQTYPFHEKKSSGILYEGHICLWYQESWQVMHFIYNSVINKILKKQF